MEAKKRAGLRFALPGRRRASRSGQIIQTSPDNQVRTGINGSLQGSRGIGRIKARAELVSKNHRPGGRGVGVQRHQGPKTNNLNDLYHLNFFPFYS